MVKVVRRLPSPRGAALLPQFTSIGALIGALRPAAPVYALFPNRFQRAAATFLTGFPGETMYAVKANPAPAVLDHLHQAGIRHFDTASLREVELIKRRYPGATCYFMAPVRPYGAAGAAFHHYGLRDFALDSEEELSRVLEETGLKGTPRARELTLYVRLAAPSDGAAIELSSKFGTTVAEGADLLKRIAAEGATPALTFHVGSLCLKPAAFEKALALCAETIRQSGVSIAAIDVGGGFPAPYPGQAMPPMGEFFAAIASMRSRLPVAEDCHLRCEPGRALVAEGMSVITQVMLRRERELYLNDGIYGSLDELSLPNWNVDYPLDVYAAQGEGDPQQREAKRVPFLAWGPTCDTLDKLPRPLMLPEDIATGDWVVFGMMGAYSCALRTGFNGFYPDQFADVIEGA
ncbi:MAG: type III PLP-dependent enzyme [Alphaproteobacteria bacterium]|nr:type III PLP-dependent enzyme [Alphaproteobacteria bacterium]